MESQNHRGADDPPPDSCRIKSSPDSGRLIIAYGTHTLGLKLTQLVILLILGSASAGIFLYIGISGWHTFWEPDLKKKILAAGALLIGTLVALSFLRRIAWDLFGMTFIIASRDSLRIQKRFLFLSFNEDIPRSNISAFRFGSDGVESRKGGTKGYRLIVKGTTECDVIPKEKGGESASWMGEKLANWFEVPFIQKPFPLGRVRK